MSKSQPMSAGNAGLTPLANKVAIVTGGGRGIGKAIAMELARQGAAVAICGRSEESLKRAKHEIDQATGEQIEYRCCDVRNEQSIEQFVEWCGKRFGEPDILVNNAGIFKSQPVEGHALSDWNEIIETNLTGAMLFSRAVLKGMIAKSFGRIINVSSVSGISGEIWASAYSASKFGMIGLTQSLALEVASKSITVNAVCPGWVITEMVEAQFNDPEWCRLNSMDPQNAKEMACYAIPQQRFTQPSEVAGLVAYLASDIAAGITGQSINIDGGLVMR